MGLSDEEYKWLYTILKKIDFMAVLSIGELEKLVSYILKKNFKKKSIVFEQGDKGDFFYIVYNGSVSIWSAGKKEKQKKIATLGPGEYFGEMALVSGDPRNASVITDNEVDLFVLFKNDFNSLLRENVQLEFKIQEIMTRRNAQRALELSAKAAHKKQGIFSKILEHLGFSS